MCSSFDFDMFSVRRVVCHATSRDTLAHSPAAAQSFLHTWRFAGHVDTVLRCGGFALNFFEADQQHRTCVVCLDRALFCSVRDG